MIGIVVMFTYLNINILYFTLKLKKVPEFKIKCKEKIGFSIIVPSIEKRALTLNTFLNFTLYDPPPSLSEIIVSWGSDQNETIEQLIHNYSFIAQKNGISLRYSIQEDKTLARRFHDVYKIQTATIFSVDDDILMPAKNIEYGYNIWKKHPTQLVGFLARYLGIQKANFSGQRDVLKYEVPGSFNKIRLILTGVAFVGRELAQAYYSPANELNVKLVQTMNNCEDILMNYVAMNKTNLSAVFILKPFDHIGQDGLSQKTRNTHFMNRTICVNKFYESFGRYPPIVPRNCMYI